MHVCVSVSVPAGKWRVWGGYLCLWSDAESGVQVWPASPVMEQ